MRRDITDFNHFIDVDEVAPNVLRALLKDARRRKAARQGMPKAAQDTPAPLQDHVLAILFEKPSTRTRTSFQVAMLQLGGHSVVLNSHEVQLGRGESIADTAKVLSRYTDAIMARTISHDTILQLADHATIPVINGLTNRSHPCQVMADIMTYEEHRGEISESSVAWLGDGNNMCTSWIHAAQQLGFVLNIATPKAFAPDDEIVSNALERGAKLLLTDKPAHAVADAGVLVADTFISMGDEDRERRLELLAPYQVNADLMAQAQKDAVFLHCLPAHRGEEVTADVIEGPQSLVFDEAENRIHIQKSILVYCLKGEEALLT